MSEEHAMAAARHSVVNVALSGEYDIARVEEMHHQLLDRALALRAPVVVADLSRVTFLDVSGLGALQKARARLVSEGGQLRLRGIPPSVTTLLEVTATGKVFVIEAPAERRPKPSMRSYECDRCGHRRPLFAMEEITDFSTVPPTVQQVCTDPALCGAGSASVRQRTSAGHA
jgi:anti-anti-sigma factor